MVAPLEALTEEVVLLVTYIKIFISLFCEQILLKLYLLVVFQELFQRV